MALADAALKLANALQSVSERFKLLQTTSKFVEGLANSLKLMAELVDRVAGIDAKPGDLTYSKNAAVPGIKDSPLWSEFQKWRELFNDPQPDNGGSNVVPFPTPYGQKSWVAPTMPANQGGKSPTLHIEKQEFNFAHPGSDPKKTTTSIKTALNDTLRQFPQGEYS